MAENEKMDVLVVEPGKKPYRKQIDSGLESLQKEVGGYIEATYPADGSALPWRQKLVLLGLVAAVTVVVTFPFSLLDPVFTATDYLLSASFTTFRCGIALLIAWIARKVQKR